jgi:hypothetical protein
VDGPWDAFREEKLGEARGDEMKPSHQCESWACAARDKDIQDDLFNSPSRSPKGLARFESLSKSPLLLRIPYFAHVKRAKPMDEPTEAPT